MSAFPPISELLVHAEAMLLLDAMIAEDGEAVRCVAGVREGNIFLDEARGLPSYVGFELMAQTISAYDGLRRGRAGLKPVIGLLLGCRAYKVDRDYYARDETLTIEAKTLLGEEGMTSFACRIWDSKGVESASAVINAFRPADPDAFLETML